MNVYFHTNIDAYKTNCFPERLDRVPRIGEKVSVVNVFIDYYTKRGLPLILEVVNVIWHENYAVCELGFTKISLDIARSNGKNLYEL